MMGCRVWWVGMGVGVLLLLLAGCAPEAAYTSTLVWDGAHDYRGVTLPGDLLQLAGSVTLAEDAAVAGAVVLLGGELRLNGRTGGDVTLLGGSLVVGPGAAIGGDLRQGGGRLAVAETAVIAGEQTAGAGLALPAVPRA
ncbi:MAG: hypothetical protein KC425_23085, partial [Anaerolineales bacterium]|nr:hypothetical protein [Anaerolineales bacterium]